MPRYLIDVNLPYYFGIWDGPDFAHVRDLNDEWSDAEVWTYARKHELTIVSKDADFSDRALLSEPPPRVIHVKLGNMRMNVFHQAVCAVWEEVCELSRRYRLVRIFPDRVEGVE